jgi:aryl-alcohol dehydrogenase-like predicted oxidoreductase
MCSSARWRAAVFTGEELERTLGYVDAVRFLEEPGHSLAEMAIRYAFSDPAVSAAIPRRAQPPAGGGADERLARGHCPKRR